MVSDAEFEINSLKRAGVSYGKLPRHVAMTELKVLQSFDRQFIFYWHNTNGSVFTLN